MKSICKYKAFSKTGDCLMGKECICNQFKNKNMPSPKKSTPTPLVKKTVVQGPTKDDVINALVEENNLLRRMQDDGKVPACELKKPEPSLPFTEEILGSFQNEIEKSSRSIGFIEQKICAILNPTLPDGCGVANETKEPYSFAEKLDNKLVMLIGQNQRLQFICEHLSRII